MYLGLRNAESCSGPHTYFLSEKTRFWLTFEQFADEYSGSIQKFVPFWRARFSHGEYETGILSNQKYQSQSLHPSHTNFRFLK